MADLRQAKINLLPESGPIGPSRTPTNIIERVSVCLSTGFVPVDQTGGVVMAWQFGRLTGMTMQSLGVAIRWQISRYGHAKPLNEKAQDFKRWRTAKNTTTAASMPQPADPVL